ncbi:unnamed protein product [Toxocara canis]|uniref:Transmembrane protein n=1 Tax=Toxocara canis TaxID=6265 RepID=A0A183UMC7_TOXCA|nr:unnamed protein product [Toxocara canis]
MSARNSTWRTATGDLSSISTATWITPPSHANTDGELTRMVPPAERHHRWFCSQIHSAVLAFIALELSDRIHYRGTRIWKTIAFPPAVLLLPSFVLQIVDLFVLGLHTYMGVRERYAAYEFASKSYGQILGDVLLLTFVPLLMSWTVLTYALFASLDAFFCVARRSHNWRVQQLPPATLTAHSSIKGPFFV